MICPGFGLLQDLETIELRHPTVLSFGGRVAQNPAFSNSAVLYIRRAAEFLRREALCYLLHKGAFQAELRYEH